MTGKRTFKNTEESTQKEKKELCDRIMNGEAIILMVVNEDGMLYQTSINFEAQDIVYMCELMKTNVIQSERISNNPEIN